VIEPFATREELVEAEALAIKSEYPKFNKATTTTELVAVRSRDSAPISMTTTTVTAGTVIRP
jgi:hypothetical protein